MNFSLRVAALVVLVTTGILPDVESRHFGEEANFHGGLEPRLDRLDSPKKHPELLTRFMAEMEERAGMEAKGGMDEGMGGLREGMGEIDEKKQLDGEKEEPRLDRLDSPPKQPQLLTRAEMEEMGEMEEMAEMEGKGGMNEEIGEIDGGKGELDGEMEERKDIDEEMECSHCEKIRKLKEGIMELLDELDCNEGLIVEDRPDTNLGDIKIPKGPFFGSFEGRVPGF